MYCMQRTVALLVHVSSIEGLGRDHRISAAVSHGVLV